MKAATAANTYDLFMFYIGWFMGVKKILVRKIYLITNMTCLERRQVSTILSH